MELFDRRTLTGIIDRRPVKPKLFKELFFSRRNPLDTTTAQLDIIVGGKSLVPFVTKFEGGTLIEGTTRESQVVETPRMRPKMHFSACNLLDFRQAGEPPVIKPGVTDDRVDKAIATDMQELKDRVEITVEYMAAKSLQGGKIPLVGETFQGEVDMRMPASHIIVLGAGDTWADAGADPCEDLEVWADLIVDATGLTPDVCVQGVNAWQAFRNNAKVQGELDNRRMETGQLAPEVGKAYRGHVNGVDIYRYGGSYHDAAGQVQKLMHPDYVVFGCTEAETTIDFGLPEDLENSGPVEYFAKSRINWDPSYLEFLAESRPLPWLKQPDAFVFVKVV
ncbi:major capsid protein [Pseudodesulfovibrio tunisiensis]|uniref:major capsid protein n=1 Tax=Pseudodesulfovibrio tunisiensis TaxID=463192 RepID=UPI001FB1B6AE|nr:major capsid protein [Pseudodesulfovibrio tunisiensis]